MGRATIVSRWSVPYRGKYREPLEGTDFYEEVGRPDLADAYRSNLRTKALAFVGGGPLLVGGATLALRETCQPADFGYGIESCEHPHLAAGMLLASAGGLLVAVMPFWSSHPVDASEARRLADVHNRKLRARLGIDDEDIAETAVRRRPRPATVRLSPVVSPHGGGLRLGMSF